MAREKGMGNLQQEKGGRWTLRVGINGKRYCRSTRTKNKEEAERYLQRFLAPLGLGESRLPLADVWFEYLRSPRRNELAQTTLIGKRNVWMHFARWMERFYLPVKDLAGVTEDMIAEYLMCVRVDASASTYNSRVCILREIFRALTKKAGIEQDPWEGVRLRPDDSHSRRELTMNELKRLLESAKRIDSNNPAIEQSNNSSEWHTLILIGIYTGLRLGDCCRLDWSQINLAGQVIQVVPQKTRRHHQRMVTIPIHPALGQALLGQSEELRVKSDELNKDNNSSLIIHHSSLTGPVLPGIAEMYVRSRWLVSQQLSRIFKDAHIQMSVRIQGRRRKIPEATFHSLRHTFVSFAANAGVPLHIVQSIVGHESTAMTRHYYHENLDALKSAVNAIPTL